MKSQSGGVKIHEDLSPLEHEQEFEKTCVNPFLTTSMGQQLIKDGIRTLFLTGLYTNYVVEAVAGHAADLGYKVYVIEDCTASNAQESHKFAIETILPTIGEVISSGELRESLKNS